MTMEAPTHSLYSFSNISSRSPLFSFCPSLWISFLSNNQKASHFPFLVLLFPLSGYLFSLTTKSSSLTSQKALLVFLFSFSFFLPLSSFLFSFFFNGQQAWLFQPPSLLPHYNAVLSNDLCSSHLSCNTPSATTFSSLSSAPLNDLRGPLLESFSTCQSPTAASKSEVDSLWSLRM